jgi:hypothetical protein
MVTPRGTFAIELQGAKTNHMETVTPTESRKNNLDIWEAWIDVQESGGRQRGTLYIIGDVPVNNHVLRPLLVKKQFNLNGKDELFLEILPGINTEAGKAVEVFYSEELESLDQFKSVTIFAGNKIIAKINEIEILF